SCWDGRNTDSANHRTHMAIVDEQGNCPSGVQPVPQLVPRTVYDVHAPTLADGGEALPLFAADSVPEQPHEPITDHGHLLNFHAGDLRQELVDCITEGRTCGAGGNGGGDNGGDNGNGGGGDGNGGGDNGAGNPGQGGDQDNGG